MSLPPAKPPKCKSYEVVKGAIKAPLTVAKVKFISFITGRQKLYLTIYQSQKSLIPLLNSNLQNLYKELLGLRIKFEVLGKYEDDCKDLLKINLRDVKNHMKKKDIYVAFGTQQDLLSILKKDCANHNDVNKFWIDIREFLVTLSEKIFDKNPILFNIVICISAIHLFQILKSWYYNPWMYANHRSKGCSLILSI